MTGAMHTTLGRRIRLYAGPIVAGTTGFALFYSYRPRDIAGFQPPAVPPPSYGADGTFRLPKFPKMPTREEQIQRLRRSRGDEHECYDMLIIGGGATGTGVALDAATRGLRVALVERDDFSSGTSSKSTKLVHGGVRYLEKAFWERDLDQYRLVCEALRERKYFLNTAPHLSMWLPIMIPLTEKLQASYYWVGVKAYDFLASGEGIESSYFLTRSKAIEKFPMINKKGLIGALVYYDGAHNDSRMNVSLATTAALYGATVVNHMEAMELKKHPDGKVWGATVRDNMAVTNGENPGPNTDVTIRAKCIVNCTGPFSDGIRKMGDPGCRELVQGADGVHVILPGYFSPSKMGLIDPKTEDGRVVFFLPWQGSTIAGTTDAPTSITDRPIPREKDIDWILRAINRHLDPEIKVRRGDVLAAWSGLRPLIKDPKAKDSQSVVRNHLIDISPSGLLTCAGGKWTTYRQMAEECVDAAVKEFGLETKCVNDAPRISGTDVIDDNAILDGTCQTRDVRLVGAHGWSKTLFIPLVQHYGIETDIAKYLADNYGDRAWVVAAMCKPTNERFPARGERISQRYPFTDGEVRYAVRCEYAQTAVDVLARRTRLAFLNCQAALEALPRVIDLMAAELKWDRPRKDLEWKEGEFFSSSFFPTSILIDLTHCVLKQASSSSRPWVFPCPCSVPHASR